MGVKCDHGPDGDPRAPGQIGHRVRDAEHEAARAIEEIDGFGLPNSGFIAKNLFLRDDKKRDYCLLVVPKDKTVDLNELRTALGTRPLSFSSEDGCSVCSACTRAR